MTSDGSRYIAVEAAPLILKRSGRTQHGVGWRGEPLRLRQKALVSTRHWLCRYQPPA